MAVGGDHTAVGWRGGTTPPRFARASACAGPRNIPQPAWPCAGCRDAPAAQTPAAARRLAAPAALLSSRPKTPAVHLRAAPREWARNPETPPPAYPHAG